IEEYSK
ncbi:hypothetical protein ACTFIU_004884, partial [Dictyostelium citrinum]